MTNTIGIVLVAAAGKRALPSVLATNTSGPSASSSCVSGARRVPSPSAQRRSKARLRPSTQPRSLKPDRSCSIKCPPAASDVKPRCATRLGRTVVCASAASEATTAAQPAASARLLVMTFIRSPSLRTAARVGSGRSSNDFMALPRVARQSCPPQTDDNSVTSFSRDPIACSRRNSPGRCAPRSLRVRAAPLILAIGGSSAAQTPGFAARTSRRRFTGSPRPPVSAPTAAP